MTLPEKNQLTLFGIFLWFPEQELEEAPRVFGHHLGSHVGSHVLLRGLEVTYVSLEHRRPFLHGCPQVRPPVFQWTKVPISGEWKKLYHTKPNSYSSEISKVAYFFGNRLFLLSNISEKRKLAFQEIKSKTDLSVFHCLYVWVKAQEWVCLSV